MAVAMFMRWSGVTSDQYDAVMVRLDLDSNPAAGGVLHVAALTDEGLEVCDVWQTSKRSEGSSRTASFRSRASWVSRDDPRSISCRCATSTPPIRE